MPDAVGAGRAGAPVGRAAGREADCGARQVPARRRCGSQQDKPKDALALVEGAVAFLKDHRERRLELFGLSDHVARVPGARRSRAGPRRFGRRRGHRRGDARRCAAGHCALEPGQRGGVTGPVAAGARPSRARGGNPPRARTTPPPCPTTWRTAPNSSFRLGRLDDADARAGRTRGGHHVRSRSVRGAQRVVRRSCAPWQPWSRCGAKTPSDTWRSVQPSSAARLGVGPGSCAARRTRRRASVTGARIRRGRCRRSRSLGTPSFASERHYWRAAAALERGRAAVALAEAERGLSLLGALSNDELRWRLAALGALAASLARTGRHGSRDAGVGAERRWPV